MAQKEHCTPTLHTYTCLDVWIVSLYREKERKKTNTDKKAGKKGKTRTKSGKKYLLKKKRAIERKKTKIPKKRTIHSTVEQTKRDEKKHVYSNRGFTQVYMYRFIMINESFLDIYSPWAWYQKFVATLMGDEHRGV